MKRAAKPTNRGTRSQTATIPSPSRGLNARDPLSAMKPTDALLLDNIICRPSYLEIRKGRQKVVTGFAAAVETLMVYSSTTSGNELWAIAGTSIFNATTPGVVPAAAVTGLSNAYWNYTQISNIAGNFLICCNGSDDARIYDGVTWGLLGVTGLPLTSISQVAVWKRRLWCVEKNTFKVWYGASDAIAGALTSFNFSGIFKRGGRLVAILNWTIDGGSGSDDFFLAVTSSGEIAVYKGTDPAVAGSFNLVGVYYIGAPVGERFYAQFGGDVLLLTADGLIAFSRYLQSQTVDRASALTDRIQELISADITTFGSTVGWEIHVFFNEGFLFIQVPVGSTGDRYQYVMTLINGAWSRLRISSARTWAVQNQALFFGSVDTVFNGWTSGTDDGESIPYAIIPAFSYFKSPTQQKKFNLARLLFQADEPPLYRTQFLADFNQEYITYPLAPGVASGNRWDVALWDAGLWDALSTYTRSWYALSGLAYAGTQAIYGISSGDIMRFISIDYVYESGGLL